MMDVINDFFKVLTVEQRELIYTVSNSMFWFSFGIALLLYFRKDGKLNIKRIIASFLIPYAVNCIIMLIGGFIKNALASWILIPTYYPVYFIPIMYSTVVLIYLISKGNFADTFDKFILAFLVSRPLHCIACLGYGCCGGAFVDWGLYSGAEVRKVIPLRLFELVLVLILWVVFHCLYIQNKFKYKGQCAALGTIGFGIVMFVFDIFSMSPRKDILFLSAVGVSALGTVAAGVIMLVVFLKKSHK